MILDVRNARIGCKNFSGDGIKTWDVKGDRYFYLFLDDPDQIEDLIEDGWNVRFIPARDPEETDQAYVRVSVKFNNFPPEIVYIANGRKTLLDEDTVAILDQCAIDKVDLVVNGSRWEMQGKKGVKAYLKTIYVTARASSLAAEYDDIPWAGSEEE